MSALHEALKSLNPISYSDVPLDELESFLSNAFSNGQLIVDSVPTPSPSSDSALPERRGLSNASSSSVSSASEMSTSFAHCPHTSSDIQALQKEWKPVKLNQKDNPLSISVYKLGAKDSKGTWFARTSIHEGLDFEKWRRGLESEFAETLKIHGEPGEGNIRGIGGEKRVEYQRVRGVGKLKVYLVSAQFPGPTAPRDFVTMNLTSDQPLSEQPSEEEGSRRFMLVSRPCLHKHTAPRDGYVRGQYESVEYIREIPRKKPSTSGLDGMAHSRRNSTLGKAILNNATNGMCSVDNSNDVKATSDTDTNTFNSPKGTDGEEQNSSNIGDKPESNPVEWIMITRSDPGGSVPRFMVERGTPNGIVSDASKFLDWACSKGIENFDNDDEVPTEHEHEHEQEKNVDQQIPQVQDENCSPNPQTDRQLVGLEDSGVESAVPGTSKLKTSGSCNLPTMVAEVTSSTSHTSAGVSNQVPEFSSQKRNIENNDSTIRRSNVSISSESSDDSFASAFEAREGSVDNDTAAARLTESGGNVGTPSHEFKQLRKLEEKKKKLDEKLIKAKSKDANKRSDDSTKDEESLRKAEEKHRKEVERIERKKEKKLRKAEEKKRKEDEKNEKNRILRALQETRVELNLLKEEKDNLRSQVMELQAANQSLISKSGG